MQFIIESNILIIAASAVTSILIGIILAFLKFRFNIDEIKFRTAIVEKRNSVLIETSLALQELGEEKDPEKIGDILVDAQEKLSKFEYSKYDLKRFPRQFIYALFSFLTGYGLVLSGCFFLSELLIISGFYAYIFGLVFLVIGITIGLRLSSVYVDFMVDYKEDRNELIQIEKKLKLLEETVKTFKIKSN